jgi:hypothetical protein
LNAVRGRLGLPDNNVLFFLAMEALDIAMDQSNGQDEEWQLQIQKI